MRNTRHYNWLRCLVNMRRKGILPPAYVVRHRFYGRLYWAIPPWITDEMVAKINALYESRTPGFDNIDHIVPLDGKNVCGLHVPWNLRRMCKKRNMIKSNKEWPDSPHENCCLEIPEFEPYQMRLL